MASSSVFGSSRSHSPILGGPQSGTGSYGPDPFWDRFAALALITAVGVAAIVLAVGHVSTWIMKRDVPRYRLEDIPGILWRVASDPGEPGAAWAPVNSGSAVPGAAVWWPTAATLVGLVAGMCWWVWRHRRAEAAPETEWAARGTLRRLKVSDADQARLVVGKTGRFLVATENRHSVLVFGPTQSGKTTGFAIPAILEWPGPVVATSVKDDLISHTIGWRSQHGDAHVFDPAGVSAFAGSSWSPMVGCDSWDGAMARAWELARAGKAAVGGADMALGDFWFASAAKALAPYLFAAATTDHTISDVARWIDAEDHESVTDLLWDHPDALLAHEATFKREDRARSSMFQVMQQIVGVYLDPAVAASAASSEISPTDLLNGDSSTLYLTAPARDQERFRPLFSTLLASVIDAAFDQVARNGGKPLDPPPLIVLDEAANIAPVDNLDQVASTAAALGIQLVTVFQDMAQIRHRYRDRTQTIMNNHRGTLFLPGIKCVDTLDYLSRLVGEREFERETTSIDSLGRRSHSNAPQRHRLLPVEVARTLDAGQGILLYGNIPPVRVELRPWFKNRGLKARATLERVASPLGDAQ